MNKQTKEILTNEKLKKELSFHMKAALPTAVALCFLSAICLLIFYFAILDMDNEGVLGIVVAVLYGFVVVVLVGASFYHLYYLIKSRSDINNGKFTVVTDILSRKVKDETRRAGRRSRVEDVFYFYKYGRYVVTVSDGSSFDYSSEGDTFYLVFFGKSKTPFLAYNSKVYEYKER